MKTVWKLNGTQKIKWIHLGPCHFTGTKVCLLTLGTYACKPLHLCSSVAGNPVGLIGFSRIGHNCFIAHKGDILIISTNNTSKDTYYLLRISDYTIFWYVYLIRAYEWDNFDIKPSLHRLILKLGWNYQTFASANQSHLKLYAKQKQNNI